MILGIDEVGRGPWAGPLVVGAVVLGDANINGLTDSKKLTSKRRESLNQEITEKAAAIGLGWVHADEIDEIGLSQSLAEATKRAILQIKVPYHEIIIDGTVNFLAETGKGKYVTVMKKADLLISSVSAASIVAKVARDKYMSEQHVLYPEYGFASHVGYGTARHQAAIEQHGITPLHRLSFSPLAKYKLKASVPLNTKVTTRVIGDISEQIACDELERRGHKIIARNWKTKYCEIDIVSSYETTYYFTEVKHRKNTRSGDGLAAITPKKLKQMKFAAKMYAQITKLGGENMRLVAVATTNDPPRILSFVEIE